MRRSEAFTQVVSAVTTHSDLLQIVLRRHIANDLDWVDLNPIRSTLSNFAFFDATYTIHGSILIFPMDDMVICLVWCNHVVQRGWAFFLAFVAKRSFWSSLMD